MGITDYAQLNTHYARGSLFETFILAEFYKHFLNQGKTPHLYFWRDKSGHEIDCLIENATYLAAIEIKSSQTLNNDFFTGLKYWQSLASNTRNVQMYNYLIYGGNRAQMRANCRVLPWSAMEELLNL